MIPKEHLVSGRWYMLTCDGVDWWPMKWDTYARSKPVWTNDDCAEREYEDEITDCYLIPNVTEARREAPLLMCADCKHTESCAGAMARQFNRGRCLRCGGFFKVVRA